MYYFLPQPPYFLLVFGLFIGVTCGLAFEATLKQKAKDWFSSSDREAVDQSVLLLPFIGICIGICVFLASGLEIFILNTWISYALALPTTLLTAALVWYQLKRVLAQIEQGGSKALDLDIF